MSNRRKTSLPEAAKSSTPIVGNAKCRTLPRPGSSNSFSPVGDTPTKNRRAWHKVIAPSVPAKSFSPIVDPSTRNRRGMYKRIVSSSSSGPTKSFSPVADPSTKNRRAGDKRIASSSSSGPTKSFSPVVDPSTKNRRAGDTRIASSSSSGPTKSFSPVVDPSTKNRQAGDKRIASSSFPEPTESKRRKLSGNHRRPDEEDSSNSSWKTTSHRSTRGSDEENPTGWVTLDGESDGAENPEIFQDGPYVTCEKFDGERRAIETIRDAPPPTADIEHIIDAPLFPRPQLGSPELFPEDIGKDAAYFEAPKLIESDEDEEYHVQLPTKTYLGTKPLPSIFKGPAYWKTIPFEKKSRKYPVADSSGWQWYHLDESRRLWDTYCAAEAEETCRNSRPAPPRKTIRNRDVMRKIRAEAAASKPEATNERKNERTRGRKSRKPSRSSSPEMITIRGNLWYAKVDGVTCPLYEDNPYDPYSEANLREEQEAEKEKRRRLSSTRGRRTLSSSESSASSSSLASSSIIVRSNEPFIGPLWERVDVTGKKASATAAGNE